MSEPKRILTSAALENQRGEDQVTATVAQPRCAVLVGPYLSGKTTLLESLLFASGSIHRKGSVRDGSTIGNNSPEAREREMTVELNAAHGEYLDDQWTFIDCPGFVELAQETSDSLVPADVAIVVCEPGIDRAITLAPLLKELDARDIPHMIFINKMDIATNSVNQILAAFQDVSDRPLVMREIPIQEGDDITGYVDLVSERAYAYHEGAASDLISIPENLQDMEQAARMEMLEKLADFDDDLLTKLLEDAVPSKDEIYQNFRKDLGEDKLVPVFFGSAENDQGIHRLLKALRHDVPGPAESNQRHGLEADGEALAWVFKTLHPPHIGKLSLARVMRGEIKDGMTLNGDRVSGLYKMMGLKQDKVAKAGVGEVVALGRMDGVRTGDLLTPSGKAPEVLTGFPEPLAAVYSAAISAEKSSDEVKLSEALAKLAEEDPSLHAEQSKDTHELLLWGQGDMHLQIAVDRLKHKFNLDVNKGLPHVPYKETITKSISQHARYKRQSGGHGQFGDVHVDIKPLPSGSGFAFDSKVVGGHVPRQFIPAVETGVKEFMQRGPLGFPIVDISVTLTDGQHHAVDSSEQSFKLAGRLAMSEGIPKCNPVLLEPICQVVISLPNEFTSKIQRMVSGRRGQIQGFEAKEGWSGWDMVSILLPQAEMHDLIVELRSMTFGVGNFSYKFDHMQELTGRGADQVVAARSEAKG